MKKYLVPIHLLLFVMITIATEMADGLYLILFVPWLLAPFLYLLLQKRWFHTFLASSFFFSLSALCVLSFFITYKLVQENNDVGPFGYSLLNTLVVFNAYIFPTIGSILLIGLVLSLIPACRRNIIVLKSPSLWYVLLTLIVLYWGIINLMAGSTGNPGVVDTIPVFQVI